MSDRTDIHRPVSLVTEEYTYVGCFDNKPPEFGFGAESALMAETMRQWREEFLSWVELVRSSSSRWSGLSHCHHCGARVRYSAILKHEPTGEHIAVGETCLDNRFSLASAEFQRLRKAAALDSKAQRIKAECEKFLEGYEDLRWMLTGDVPEASVGNGFISDVMFRFRRYGSMSERQVEAIRKAIVRDAERAAQPVVEVPPAGPAPEGWKVDIEGVVVGLKVHDNDFGSTLKMTVLLDNGSRVWCSVPSSASLERGDRISFRVSQVYRSDSDETFAFAQRPTRLTIIEAKAAAA